MSNHFVGHISFFNSYLENTIENQNMVKDFLLLAKEIFNKYAHTNFVPESIQLITLTGNGYDIELFHKNFSKSLNYMMQELISEANNYLIV